MNTTLRMWRFFCLVVAASSLVSCGRQQPPQETQKMPESSATPVVELRIPDTRFMGILPIYIAEEKGFLQANGLKAKWVDVRDPGQGGKLLTAGEADFIMTTFANLIPAEARQPGSLRFLYPIYESAEKPGSYVLVKPGSDIKSLADLRGKTLGTYSGPSQKAYALMVLRKLGLREPDDVRLIQVASSAQVQGLFGGSYDALFTVETHGSTAIQNGAVVVEKGVRTKYISNPFWLGCAAIPASLAKQRPTAVAGLINALEEAGRFIATNENEAREILARRTGTDEAVARRCYLYDWVAHPNEAQLREIQEQIDLLVTEKLIDVPVNVRALFEGAQAN